jgi:hypothetical protein
MRLRQVSLSTLIVMAPVRQRHADDLLAAIAALRTGEQSPFARIESTHFARFALIPALLDGDGEPAEFAQSYLLFSADFDGRLENWSAAVASRAPEAVDSVLGHCEGYPGTRDPRALLAFLKDHRVPTGFSIVSYHATVETIRRSLELRRSMREFAVLSQQLYPSELRGAWKRRFAA